MRKRKLLRAAVLILSTVLVVQSLGLAAVSGDENTGENTEDNTTVSEMDEYVYLKNEEIPSSSIIIGSYVIHLKGLTDAVYSQAEETMNTYNQFNKYYKSELAGGKWFDISSATSLSAITDAGTAVDVKEIESLKITHMVSETGEVTDLRTGYSVSVFDLKAPYSLMDMEELEPLNQQYELLRDKESKTDSDKVVMFMLEEFYTKDIQTYDTNKYDDIVSGLEKYRNDLMERSMPLTWVDEVQKVMKHVDAMRRVEAFENLTDNLNDLLDRIAGQGGKTYYFSDENTTTAYIPWISLGTSNEELREAFLHKEDSANARDYYINLYLKGVNSGSEVERKRYKNTGIVGYVYDLAMVTVQIPKYVDEYYVNTDMSQAIGEAISKVEESVAKYQAMILNEGDTATSKARFQYSNDLMDSITLTTRTETYYTEEVDYLQWYTYWWRPWSQVWLRVRSEVIKHITYDQEKADEATRKLVDSTNIARDMIVDVTSEARTAKEMSTMAAETYKERLAAGVDDGYKTLVAEQAALSVKMAYLQGMKEKTDDTRYEYQSLLKAWFDRMSNTALQFTVEELLDQIPDMEALPPMDDVRLYHLDTVADHEAWLRGMLSQAVKDSSDSTEMDKLTEELDNLNEKKQSALDDNNLAEAKKIDAEIEAKESDIDNLASELEDIIDSPNSSYSEKARAEAELGENNTASEIHKLAEDIKEYIRESSSGGTGSDIGGNTGEGQGGTGTGEGQGGNGEGQGGTGEGQGGSGTGEGQGGSGTGEGQGGTGTGEGQGGTGTGEGQGGSGTGQEGQGGSTTGGEGQGGSGTGEGQGGTGTGEGQGGSTTGGEGQGGTGTGGEGQGESTTGGEGQGGTGGEGQGGTTVNPGTLTSDDKAILNKLDALSALSELNPEAGNTALTGIQNAIDNASALKPVLSNALNTAVAEAKQKVDDALNRNASNLSSAEIKSLIEALFGKSIDELSSMEMAGVVLALTRFGYDFNNVDARNLAISLANDMYREGNIYIYLKYSSDTKEYVSLRAMGIVLGYRYVFDDVHCTVTLTKGRNYRTFEKDSDDYLYTGEKSAKLDSKVLFQDTLYLYTADSNKLYNVNAGYVHGCDYAVVATTAVEKVAKQVYDRLVEESQ